MRDYDVCEETKSGKHKADTSSFHLERDGDAVYLDVNCLHCGLSGCVGKFDANEVTWS